jgi:Pyrroline-5-carboxylate reductase
MPNVGFIGYGSMGSMLVEGFLTSHVLEPKQIMVSTHNPEKLAQIEQNLGVSVCASN